jgi:hypothetical protein
MIFVRLYIYRHTGGGPVIDVRLWRIHVRLGKYDESYTYVYRGTCGYNVILALSVGVYVTVCNN